MPQFQIKAQWQLVVTLIEIYSGLNKDLIEGYETSAKRQASYVVESENAFLRLETEEFNFT